MVLLKPKFKEDREIERELATEGSERFMAKPKLIRRWISRMEFEILREEVIKLRRIVDAHEETINYLNEKIAFLETRHRKMELTSNLKAISDKNVRLLREMFALPEITGEIKKDILAKMKGMLKEYSEKEIDSVELLHSMRGEKR